MALMNRRTIARRIVALHRRLATLTATASRHRDALDRADAQARLARETLEELGAMLGDAPGR